ncbi:hypothetical protein RhiirA5_435863, partial [Rhizophagus irregularis]
MSGNNENELVTEFNELDISDKDPNSSKINHEKCYDPDNKKYWYTIYNASNYNGYPLFLEWVPFDRFKDMKQIGE